MFALELARRFGDQGMVSISLNTGNLKTDLDRRANWSNTIKYFGEHRTSVSCVLCSCELVHSGSSSQGPQCGPHGRLYGPSRVPKMNGSHSSRYFFGLRMRGSILQKTTDSRRQGHGGSEEQWNIGQCRLVDCSLSGIHSGQ